MLANGGEMGQGQLERNVFPTQLIKELDQGDIGLGDRLEEPAFLQEALELRMTDIRKMGVENEQQISFWHR